MLAPGTDLRRYEWSPTDDADGSTVAVRLLATTDAEGGDRFELDATTVEPGDPRRYNDFVVGTYADRDRADDAMNAFVRTVSRSLDDWSATSAADRRLPYRVREAIDSFTGVDDQSPKAVAPPVAVGGDRRFEDRSRPADESCAP